MGEAKRRGTREERVADPKGDSWNTWNEKYWSPERIERFRVDLGKDMSQYLAMVKRQLFSVKQPKKRKNKKIKTGG